MASLKEILSWFEKNKYPTQEQFKESWTSFWHKSEKMPMEQVVGLQDELSDKALKLDLNAVETELKDKASKEELANVVAGLVPMGSVSNLAELETKPKRNNDSYYVEDQLSPEGDAYIYRWDEPISQWVNTKQVVFKDVARKEDFDKLQPDGCLKKANMLYYIGGYDNSNGYITPADINLHKTSGYIENKVGDRIKIKGAYTVATYDINKQSRKIVISDKNMENDFAIYKFKRDGYFAINYEFSPNHDIVNKIGNINTILVAFYPKGVGIVENKVEINPNARLFSAAEQTRLKCMKNKVDLETLSPLGIIDISKNRIDPDMILNGSVSSQEDYGLSPTSDYKIAVFNVKPQEKITISGWNTVSSNIALMTGSIPILPIMDRYNTDIVKSGSTGYVFGYNKVNGQITFVVPDEVTWIAFTVQSPGDNTAVSYNMLQAELGDQPTKYTAYSYQSLTIDKGQFQNKNLLVTCKDSNIIIRSKFNSEKDMVRTLSLYDSGNGASNLTSTFLINKYDDIDSENNTLIHKMNDVVPAPFQVHTILDSPKGYMNIAGNHGIASVADIKSLNHKRTNSDLWSIWKGANDVEVYLVDIVDSDTLRYCCKPTKESSGFDKIVAPTSPLQHMHGATNTKEIAYTGGLYEYKPAIRDKSVKVYADDIEITENGDYNCDEFKVIDKHIVADPTQVIIQTPYLPYNNGAMIENTVIHRFTKFAYISELLPIFKKSHNARNISPIQPQCLTSGVYTDLKAYSMNIKPKDGHNFDLGVDLSASRKYPYLYVYNTDLKDQSKHYQQLSEILYTGTQPSIGMGAGYLPIGMGKSDIQPKNAVIFGISPAKKYYPYGKTGIVALNEIPRSSGFISYFDASVNPDLSMCFLVPYSNGYLLYLKLINEVTNNVVRLPEEALNREFELLWDGNIRLVTDDYTTNEGLIISGNVGDYCILKIK